MLRLLAVDISLWLCPCDGQIFSQVRIYKYNVVHILYNQTWFVSAFCSPFTGWPAGSAVKRACLRGERPAFESRLGHFVFLTFDFQLNYSSLSFSVDRYG